MDNNDILSQLSHVRKLFAEAGTADYHVVEKYAWLLVKVLNSDALEDDSVQSRKCLADYMNLNVKRPSKLHSALLYAACKMSFRFADFHFAKFLEKWDLSNLRKEDFVKTIGEDGKVYNPFAERVVKAYMHALLLRPEEVLPSAQLDIVRPIAQKMRFSHIRTMIVVKTTKAEVRGRTMYFAHLVDKEGNELSCEIHDLLPNPLTHKTGEKYYVNVGQLYDVLPRWKVNTDGETSVNEILKVEHAYLSSKSYGESYPVTIGYVDSYDATHQYYHIYDKWSRHFVADGAACRLGSFGRPKVQVGDFVRFAPIIPKPKKKGEKVFKSAYVVDTISPDHGPEEFGLREAKVVYVDQEKRYYRWELIDPSNPIMEVGADIPPVTTGFVSFETHSIPHIDGKEVPQKGDTILILAYLRRGKDGQKHAKTIYVKQK